MKELEEVVSDIGGSGFYQKRLMYLILGPLFFLLPMSWMNEMLLLHVPNHWCMHPHNQQLNSSNQERWKDCYVPLKKDGTHRKCAMALPASVDMDHFWNESWHPRDSTLCPTEEKNMELSKCRSGWNFDQTNFKRTVVTDNMWVCDDANNVPVIFTVDRAGSIFGTAIFLYFGDMFGRRRLFWITTAMVVASKAGIVLVSHSFSAFLALSFIAAASFPATYQLPFSIITEICDPGYRSWALGINFLQWVVGVCFLPLIAWLSGDWVEIALATSLPLILIFFGYKHVPESPRWLLSQVGKTKEAGAIFREIARANGKPEPKDLDARLVFINEKILSEKHYGYLSLFSRKGLALKTIKLSICLEASQFVYQQLTINISNMAGNVFINFFLMSVIEGPACFLGMWLCVSG